MISIKKHLPSLNFHIAKRENTPVWVRIGIRALAILAAFLACSLIIAIAYGKSPIDFLVALFDGVLGTERRRWVFLFELAILLCFSISLVPAFKMKYWNCGADGQALISALTCAGCMHYMSGKQPDAVVILVSLVLSVIAGIIWAVIPAIFKAFFNTNETLFTLMMNYIAIQFVLFFIKTWAPNGSGKLNPIDKGTLPQVVNAYVLPILIVILITAIITVYLKYTKHGFEVALVGESEKSAKYAGINVKWVIIRTLILSGAIAGLIGFILVSGYNHTVSDTITDSRGFTGIIVTWMAGMNPLYMILASFLVVFLKRGTNQFITNIGIKSSAFQDIILGIFFFFIIGCEFFIRYKIMHGHNEAKKKEKKIDSPLLEGLNKSYDEDSYVPMSEGEANDTFRKAYKDSDKKVMYSDTDDIDDLIEASTMDPNDFLGDVLEEEDFNEFENTEEVDEEDKQ